MAMNVHSMAAKLAQTGLQVYVVAAGWHNEAIDICNDFFNIVNN